MAFSVSKRKLKGSVLGFSVMILAIFLFSGVTVVSVAVLGRKASSSSQKSIIAFQAADSGAERILKRVYIDNTYSFSCPNCSLAVTPLNGILPDQDLNELTSNLCSGGSATCSGASCAGGVITAANSPASPNYTFKVTFYNAAGAAIACGDNQWRDKLIRIRAEGNYFLTSRVIEIGIRPRT